MALIKSIELQKIREIIAAEKKDIVIPKDSSEISLITVIMGERNITSTVVNDNKISVPNVSGDIIVIGKGTTIFLMGIDDMVVNKGEPFYISYCTNIPAVKHEISLDGGRTFTNRTSEIKTSYSISYRYLCSASNSNSINAAIRVTDVNGNINTKHFTITLVDTNMNIINLMTYNKGIDLVTAAIKNDTGSWVTENFVTVVPGQTYTVKMNATWCKVFSFDEREYFKSALVTGSNSNPQEYTFVADSSSIKIGCYDPSRQLTYCTIKKVN